MLSIIENTDDLVSDFEQTEIENTKTFGINLNTNTVGGKIDDLDAIKQSIYLTLNVEADQYIIYPYTYGVNTVDLIGKSHSYVIAILPGRIKETLLSDNRITDVSNFEFEVNRNQLHCTFEVSTIYGNFETETVVTI